MLKAIGLSLKFTVNLKIDLVHRLVKVYKNKQKLQYAQHSDQIYQQKLYEINNLLGAWVSHSSEATRFASMSYRKLSL
jgi:hypothetical protein